MEYPILPTEVETINKQLIEHFGLDTVTGKPIWRVSWCNDQYEMRQTKFTDSGLELLFPEVRLLRKYNYLKDRWLLERLVLIPESQQTEIPQFKQSYECMWNFEDRHENAVQPTFIAAKFVIDTVHAAQGKSSLAKYVDEEAKNPIEAKEKRIRELEEQLFGDESNILGRTVTGEAIVVPRNYEKETK